MGEAALKLVETTDVEKRAISIVDQAKAVKVTDSATYAAAGEIWKAIGEMMKEVDTAFDKNIKLWHEGHKNALADKARYWNPLDAAKRSIKQIMSTWDTEQERIRQAEQARLAEIARKEEEARRKAELDRIAAEAKAEEDRLMEAALAAEASGDGESAAILAIAAVEAEQNAKQEAAAIQAEPVYVAPVVLAKTTPKVQGIVYTTRWSASVTDIKALCLAIGTGRASTEFVIGLDRNKDTGVVTSPSLNKQAVSLMQTLAIPGVTAISKRV